MRAAEAIVNQLLEAAVSDGMVAFGPGYPPDGIYYPDLKEWYQRLARQKLGHLRNPDFEDVLDMMVSRGYGFVIPSGQGLRVISDSPIATNKEGFKNLMTRFGLEPDALVSFQTSSGGNKVAKRLHEVVLGFDYDAYVDANDKALKAQEERRKQRAAQTAWKAAYTKRAVDRIAARKAVGFSQDPNVPQNYPVEVRIGASFANSPANIGVVVTFVEENSPAAKAGLRRGDIVYAIGEYFGKADRHRQSDHVYGPHRIDTVAQWKAVAGHFIEGDTYELRVLRGDGETAVPLIPEQMKRRAP